MRSLRTAARMVVLVTLTGAAPGCGYPNPGFKLKDSDPLTSGEETTEISGVTMMTSEPGTTTTATPTTSTSTTESMTTQGPGVSGSETSTTDVDPTTSTAETTMGMPVVEWPPCNLEETKPSKAKLAAADSFLLKEIETGQEDCGIEPAEGQCRDLNLGATDYFELYFEQGGFPMDSIDDTASVFAVRFDKPDPPMHDNLMVPMDSIIGMRVTIHVGRPFPKKEWAMPSFNVFKLNAEEIWPEGAGFGPTPCEDPGVSYRCSQCKSGPTCLKPWIGTYPYPTDLEKKVIGFTLIEEPPVDVGKDVTLDFPIEALSWLTVNGLVVVPETGTEKGTIEVKAKEYDNGGLGPFIQYLYCPPVIMMP